MATALRGRLQGLLGTDFRPAYGHMLGTASPADQAELADVIATATAAGTVIVPRGSGSSPYAAAQTEAGLLVSFEHLNRIIEVDPARQLVTLEPGVLWQDLLDHLRPMSLSARMFPSSRAFSTVGGFAAQGGAGVGSYEFGDICRSIEALRVMDSTGRARDLEGPDLDLVVGAEGRTGLVSQLTLHLQPLPYVAAVIGLFETGHALEASISACAELRLPLWSVSYIDPVAGAARSDHGGPRRPLLPADRYAALYLCRMDGAGVDELAEVIRALKGTVSHEVATVERWIDRFMGLQVLRTTPLPLQFRLPAGRLGPLVESIPRELQRNLGLEGVAVDRGEEIVVRFLFAWRALSPAHNVELANRLFGLVKAQGGRPYATGAFFVDRAELTYGAARLRRLQEFHASQDPGRLLNPGRAFPDV